ncbi:MAG: myxosortase-dependent metalloprotease, MXAN_2677/MXAN_2678 family [Cystobacter sp.]
MKRPFMKRPFVMLAFAALCSGAFPAGAQAYHRALVTGRPLCVFWPVREFVYHLDAAGSARTPGDSEFAAIDAAVASWRAVSATCSDYTFRRGPDIARPFVGYVRGEENENVFTFRESDCNDVVPPGDPCIDQRTCRNVYACWEHDGGVLALTTTTYVLSTGKVLDADIELNAAGEGRGFLFTTVDSPPCSGERVSDCVVTDVQNTMTHELGHVVGLDHVPEQPGSTMEPAALPGETHKRIIDAGSVAGFCDTYPRGLPPTQCNENPEIGRNFLAVTRGLGSGCAAAPGALLLPVSALFGAWSVGRRRRGSRRG